MFPSTLSSAFEQSLREEKLIAPRDRLFAACSGGPDSTALFFLLHGISKAWQLKLRLIHFNHGLRGKFSRLDERFVRQLGKTFGVPVDVGRGNIEKLARREKISLEEAARQARYEFFIKTAKKRRISKVALGHTQDDQAETVLMRLIQGTGLKGLCGIRREVKMGGVLFVRPLLNYSKRALEEFLKQEKIPYRKDASNKSLRFLRNRIRAELIPWLVRKVNPRSVEAIARIPAIVGEEVKLLESLEVEAWKKSFKSRRGKKIALSRKAFLKFSPSIQFRLLDRALKGLDPRSGLNFELWRKLRPQLARSKYRCSLPRGLDLSFTPTRLIFYPRKFC